MSIPIKTHIKSCRAVATCFISFVILYFLFPGDKFIELIKAVAALAWPTGAFLTIYYFKDEIKHIIKRVRKAKVLGAEVEIGEAITDLNHVVEEISAKWATPGGQITSETRTISQDNDKEIFINKALTSPKAALLLLSSEIERETRQLLASLGLLKQRQPVLFTQMTDILVQRNAISLEVVTALQSFWDIRNKLIHGVPVGAGSDDDLLKMIDIGTNLLNALKSTVRQVYTVHEIGIEIYSDKECSKRVEGVFGVILETITSNGDMTYAIYPTRKTSYEKGVRVSWEWNMDFIVPESWYKDPETSQIRPAWSESAEFVGRPLDDI